MFSRSRDSGDVGGIYVENGNSGPKLIFDLIRLYLEQKMRIVSKQAGNKYIHRDIPDF
jgi:hypothetical protein